MVPRRDNRRPSRRGILALALLGPILGAGPAAAEPDLHLFAAMTLRSALDAVVQRYEGASGQHVVVAYAPTPMLVRQIEQGAPADVFLSADADWMDELAGKKLIRAGSRSDLLSNRLVLVGPSGAKDIGEIGAGGSLTAVVGSGRLAMCNPTSHPAGRYAKASLEKLGLWPSLSSRIAIARDPAAAVVMVQRGEVPAAVAFATDARGVDGVKIIGEFPAASHPPIAYPVAIVAASRNPAATDLLAFLRSAPAKAIFEDQGYTIPQ
ncbi:MAG TPA: molybdate ABC transporter substrate-binding protein [Hyphomicrobiales bacterium]|nr:molybdate ABC transporter substrate-binding protein [Hyphomicrobiales bacterium]